MNFELRVLGTSAAVPTKHRFPSSQLLQIGGETILLDCGEGCQIRLKEYFPKTHKIRYIFISHLHGDHIYGLPGLLSGFSLSGREKPLTIIGPTGVKEWLMNTMANVKLESFTLDFIELTHEGKNPVLDFGIVQVSSFPLQHRIETYGYLFEMKRDRPRKIRKDSITNYNLTVEEILLLKSSSNVIRPSGTIDFKEVTYPLKNLSFAYCTDTKYFPELSQFIKGVQTLYIESTFDKSLADLALRTMHCTTSDAARIAVEAQAEFLICGHLSARYGNTDIIKKELQEIFHNSVVVKDGDWFDLNLD